MWSGAGEIKDKSGELGNHELSFEGNAELLVGKGIEDAELAIVEFDCVPTRCSRFGKYNRSGRDEKLFECGLFSGFRVHQSQQRKLIRPGELFLFADVMRARLLDASPLARRVVARRAGMGLTG